MLGRAGHQPAGPCPADREPDVQVAQALVVGVVEHLEAGRVAVERQRLVLIGDADHHSPDRPEHAREATPPRCRARRPGTDVAAFQRRRRRISGTRRACRRRRALRAPRTPRRAYASRRARHRRRARAGRSASRRSDQRRRAAQHRLGVPALVQVGHEHYHGLRGVADERLAVAERLVDVGAAAELDAEEQVDRVMQARSSPPRRCRRRPRES